LFEDDIRAVSIHGGLVSYHSLLLSPFCYVPHDAVVPGALTAGDLSDVAAALSPRPLRLAGVVDGRNRRATAALLESSWEATRAAYRAAGKRGRLVIEEEGKDTP